jgi:MscS family membrane protein
VVRNSFAIVIFLSSVVWASAAAPTGTAVDPLSRENPRSSVTAFLQACHQDDYAKAAQYLDLSRLPARRRATDGPGLAKNLESLLNSASQFDVLRLSQDPQGNPSDDQDPALEHVTTIISDGEAFTIELRRIQAGPNAPPVWVFASDTVAKLPDLVPAPSTEGRIAAHLPRLLVTSLWLETPLWKWLALLIAALLLFGLFRLLVRVFDRLVRSLAARSKMITNVAWLQAIIDPLLVLLSVILFRVFEQMIAPSALTRLYVGRALVLVVVSSFAWGFINLLDYVILRVDRTLDQRQRVVSRSVMYLGRRILKTMIAAFAAITILDNWGFNMTTIIAGLGVGGIAIALAAQQTIANVFGGVSVIGDAPVMVGDSGNFGGVIGTIEGIGLRSARIRTTARTMVSIPNSAFAGMNLENYTMRDKMLFNPIFTIKRTTAKDQIRRLLTNLCDMLKKAEGVEIGDAPVRISAYAAAGFTIEIFVYVLTSDINEYHQRQAELYLAIDDVVTASNVELV